MPQNLDMHNHNKQASKEGDVIVLLLMLLDWGDKYYKHTRIRRRFICDDKQKNAANADCRWKWTILS